MMSLLADFEVEVAGRTLFLPRSLDVLRRAENAIGAIDPFARRLDKGLVTTAELARLYESLCRAHPDGPAREEIEAWVFRVGLYGHQRTAAYLISLVVGSDNLARAVASAPRAEGESRGHPFVKAA